MSVKKVSSEVAFITEPRTDFTRAAKPSERNVTLGSWPASSIVLARKWVDPDEATVEVEMPADAAFAIFPQRSDASVRERARYISVPTPVGQRRVFLIDEVDLQELDAEHVKASIKALSPEAWLSQVPSTIAGADQTFEGRPSAAPFLAMLYESTVGGRSGAYPCTETIQGVQYRALPITAPGTNSFYETQLDYYGIQDTHFDPSHSPSDGKPTATADDSLAKPGFPAPIGDTIFKLLKSYPYQLSMEDGVEGVEYRSEFEACLVPVPSPYDDGCLWWAWLFHQKQAEPIWISRQAGTADGEATLHLTTGKTDAIAWIADSVEGSAGKAATASFPGKPRYAGPWASVEAKEVSEGQGLGKADAAREAAAALAGLQAVVTIDATANAGSDSIDAIKLRPGTIAGVRFGKQAFTFPINEVDYSFSVDKGWEIKAPVSVETNSIDYRYPWWQGENPVPPEVTKAGLKQLFGGGWRGSIAQDLHGEWWVIGSTGKDYTIGEPVAQKIDELSAEAELIAITNAQASTSMTSNWVALFNDSEKALAVSTGIARDGYQTTITPVVSEVTLDSPVVSAVETPSAGRFTVVTEAGTVYTVTVNAAGEPSVQKLDGDPAFLYKPTTFIPGPQWREELLVANGGYALLLWHEDDRCGSRLYKLQPGEQVLLSPQVGVVVTTQRVIGLTPDPSEALATHGEIVGAWSDTRSFDDPLDVGFWLGMADGALLYWNRSGRAFEEALPASAGRTWGGVSHDNQLPDATAWGSAGIFDLHRTSFGAPWTSRQIESKAVLSYAAGAYVTEDGRLKLASAIGEKVVPCSFTPKRCWSTLAEATIIETGGNDHVVAKGEILVAGDGTDFAVLTQRDPSGTYTESKIEVSSPVKQVVRPSSLSAFFLLLEDGSIIDHYGSAILTGEAEDAKATAIAIEEHTGRLLIATERGCFSAGSTRDFFFDDPSWSKPETGDLKRLEGAWGPVTAVGSGFMAGPEEAHMGRGATSVKSVEFTSTAVGAVQAGDYGCFILLEDGRVCLQADGSGACWLVAEAPDGWKPTHLSLPCTASARKVIAWSEDGHSELIGPVTIDSNGYPHVGEPKIIPQLDGGLSKIKTNGNDAWGLSGGKLVALNRSGGWHEEGEAHGATGITDYALGYPILIQQGEQWLRWVDGQLKTINGLSGELLSIEDQVMSTAGGAVDFSSCRRRWSEEDSRWHDEGDYPAIVSTEPGRFLGDRGGAGFFKQAGGRYSMQWTENAAPEDHSQPWWPKTCSLQLVDSEVDYGTASTHGALFWLGSEGLTDGRRTLRLTEEQREAVDWEKLAEIAGYSGLGDFSRGLLVPLKSGQLAWLKAGQPLTRFSSLHTEGLLALFGGLGAQGQPALAASTSSVTAVWPGTGLQESPLLLTAEPRGLRGEELTPVVWGRYGLSRWGEGRWQATWPATEGLGAVKEARVVKLGADAWAVAACEHGLVSPATYSYQDSTASWPGEGLHFLSSGYRQPDNGQLAVIRTAEGQLWFFYHVRGHVFLVKTTINGVVADVASTCGVPITVTTSEGLTMLTVKADGTYTAEQVEGSLPATTAYKRLASDAAIAYDSETGDLQALVEDNVASQELIKASEPTETGLTSIRGEGTNNPDNWSSAPIVYGESGVVAVSLKNGKLAGESWSEKLSKLGFPGAEDSDDELPIL